MTSYRIPMARPDLGGRELDYVMATLRRTQLTMGEMVHRFEAAFAERLGVRHAIAVSSGTAALHLALLAAGVKPGDRVLVPTLTYVATVAAVRYCGAIPVFADARPDTWTLDDPPGVLARTLAAVVPVHLYGVDAGLWGGTSIIEDAAEGLGGTNERGRPQGTRGDLGIFSFYGNKILTTGEGGMVVTDDDGLADEVRLLRGQGQDPSRRYWHVRVGYNYRMTDLQAAIGVGQLERLDEMLEKRRTLERRYCANLHDARLTYQVPRPGTTRAPWVFACLLPRTKGIGERQVVQAPYGYPGYRDGVMSMLAEHGIETRPTFPCVHQMPPYKEFTGAIYPDDPSLPVLNPEAARFPIAEDISNRGLLLPLYSTMTLDQVDEVCDRLRGLL